jgi:hypothetical protein
MPAKKGFAAATALISVEDSLSPLHAEVIMRCCVFVLLLVSLAAPLFAAPPEDIATELRDLEWRLYERVDFPLRVRRLETEIKLAETRLKSLEKLLVEYQSFQKFSTGNPLTLTVEDTRYQILELKLRLENLREERLLLDRYKDDQRRLFELRRASDSVRAKVRVRVE